MPLIGCMLQGCIHGDVSCHRHENKYFQTKRAGKRKHVLLFTVHVAAMNNPNDKITDIFTQEVDSNE